MNRPSSVCLAVGTALTALFIGTQGHADPARNGPTASQGDYSYRFVDDPLMAGGFGVNDARIVVAGHPIRTTLIRPRTAFIVEMVKTVENL